MKILFLAHSGNIFGIRITQEQLIRPLTHTTYLIISLGASLTAANVSSPNLNSSEREVGIIQKESVNDSEKAALFSKIKANSKADYLMILSSVTVDQEVTNNSYTTMNANGTMTPTNSSEVKCIVKIDVEMWDVAAQSKVLEFTSHGDEKVIFFATDAALRNATATSVENLSNYVLTGKM